MRIERESFVRWGLPVLLLVGLGFFCCQVVLAEVITEDWASTIHIEDGTNSAKSIAIDSSGNSYVGSYHEPQLASFDLSPYVTKYDSTGGESWQVVISIPAGYTAAAPLVALSSNNDVFVTVGASIIPQIFDSTTWRGCIVTAKLQGTDGALLWSDSICPDSNGNVPRDVVVDSNDDLYIAGSINQIPGTLESVFAVMKYNTSGSRVWTLLESGSGDSIPGTAKQDAATNIAVDASNNIYATGYKYNTNLDIFTAKINSATGGIIWSSTVSDSGAHDNPSGLAVDSVGNSYVIGSTASYYQIITVKYDSGGNQQWMESLPAPAPGGMGIPTGIVIGSDNTVYVSGGFSVFMTPSLNEFFIRHYDSAGNELSVNNLDISPISLAIDSSDNLYITGSINFGDIHTASYESSGDLIWEATKDGSAGLTDMSFGVTVSPTGSAYVVGQSGVSSGNYEAITIKYSPPLPPGPVCGNTIIEVGETCDDGNTDSWDGCSDVCIVEDDFGVHVNEGLGVLERYAWSDNVGWIDFNGVTYNSTTGELSGVANLTGITSQGYDGSLMMRGDCSPTCGGYGVSIDSRNRWTGFAWNERIGWIDFAPAYGGVYHNPAENPSVAGWAWGDVIGWVEMGRAVYPPPTNECGASPYNTCKYAWSDSIGWISHNSIDDPNVPVFGVHADVDANTITGHSWNDILGYIDFSTASFDGATGELFGDATILDLGVDGDLSLRGDCTPSCGGYGVDIDTAAGTVNGYAWNDTIGWVDFQPTFGGVFYNEGQTPSITGWAWNDSYGWISFRFTEYDIEYGVNLENSGNYTGYAWNDNIGWIDYNPAGPYPAVPQYSVRWDSVSKEVSGWARAVSIDAAGSDGWIQMRDSAGAIAYGVTVDDIVEFGDWSGYSWSESYGWTAYDHPFGAVHTDFAAVAELSTPVLIEPLDCVNTYTINPLSALTPVLDWSDYSSTDGSTQINYQIQVDTDPLFGGPLVDETVPSDGSLYTVGLGVLDFNYTYYWRVRVENSDNELSEWGEQGSAGENNCFNTPLHPAPVCSFTMAPTIPIVEQPVQFTDTTQYYGGASGAEWRWDFGDGDTEVGTDPIISGSPIHTYEDQIDVTIVLEVTDSDGYQCSTTNESSVGLQLPEFKSIIPR